MSLPTTLRITAVVYNVFSLKLNSLPLLWFDQECLEVSVDVAYHTLHKKVVYFWMKNSGCLQGLMDGQIFKNSLSSVNLSAKYTFLLL